MQSLPSTLYFSWPWPHSDYAPALAVSTMTALLCFLIFLFNKQRTTNPPLPPGPKGFPLVGHLFSLDPQLHTYLFKISQSHGPIFMLQLGRKTNIVITSPSLAKEVLKNQDTNFCNRDVPMAAIEAAYGGLDIVWAPYGPTWRKLRKVAVSQLLSNKNLDSIYILRRRELRQMIRYMYDQVGTPVDIGEQIFVSLLNVITCMMWGGGLTGDDRKRIGAEFKKVVEDITELLGAPNLSDYFPGLDIFDFQGIRKKMKRLANKFDRIFDTIIEKRVRMNGEESRDFLHVLLKLKGDESDGTPLTMTHIKALLMDMVVGGTDTTSSIMEYALVEMMNKPEVLQKVQQELDSVVGRADLVEDRHISNLPYLYCVMKETLRLHPALPLLVPRRAIIECKIAGYKIPKDACILINVWAIQRDPSLWENPLEFRPERFEHGKWDYNGNDFTYFPFGSGRRICVGISVAERIFMHTLASMIHSFEWSLPAGHELNLSDKCGIVLKKKTPLVAIPTPRLSDPSLYM